MIRDEYGENQHVEERFRDVLEKFKYGKTNQEQMKMETRPPYKIERVRNEENAWAVFGPTNEPLDILLGDQAEMNAKALSNSLNKAFAEGFAVGQRNALHSLSGR